MCVSCIKQPHIWMCLNRALPANWVVRCWFVCEHFIVAVQMWVGNDDDDDKRSIASKPNMRNKNDKPLLMAAVCGNYRESHRNTIARYAHAYKRIASIHSRVNTWSMAVHVLTCTRCVYWLKVKAAWRRKTSTIIIIGNDHWLRFHTKGRYKQMKMRLSFHMWTLEVWSARLSISTPPRCQKETRQRSKK